MKFSVFSFRALAVLDKLLEQKIVPRLVSVLLVIIDTTYTFYREIVLKVAFDATGIYHLILVKPFS